jgi:hypothetical protein
MVHQDGEARPHHETRRMVGRGGRSQRGAPEKHVFLGKRYRYKERYVGRFFQQLCDVRKGGFPSTIWGGEKCSFSLPLRCIGKSILFCDSALLAQHTTFEFH